MLQDVFSGMDAHTAEIVSSRLLGIESGGLLRKRNTTVIFATHSRTWPELLLSKVGSIS